MSFTLRPAVREKIGLLFGVAGASGSGKTFSALLLAKGIANGTGRIAVIDTEAGRALHYAPKSGAKADAAAGTFDFLHLDFQPPFTPERYIEAIRACEEAGATVIVIDSMSHEWAGEGGCADMQAAEAERMATNRSTGKVDEWKIETMTAPAWKKPKQRHQRMMAHPMPDAPDFLPPRAREDQDREKAGWQRNGDCSGWVSADLRKILHVRAFGQHDPAPGNARRA